VQQTKISYLLLDRKSHTKSKIASKGYKTSPFASQRGGRKGAQARGWGEGGAARQTFDLNTYFPIFWTLQQFHQGRIYSPTLKNWS
jgi:hypothetical protein